MTDEFAVRLEKLQRLHDAGEDPYPARVERTHTVRQVLDAFADLDRERAPVRIVGRVRAVRRHGGLTFVHLEDGTDRMQVAVRKDTVGENAYARFQETVDIGDFLAVRGPLFTTKVGERSVDASTFAIVAKALLPLPEKWHGLADTEIRYRQRYLDLIANPEVRAVFRARSAIVSALRRYLDERGFVEVETPILQAIPGGAAARPFETRHNALGMDMYLRIAPELHLKRLIIGGFERVYEIGRNFRNEGIDHLHNPEFTSLELYEAYADYGTHMAMTEELLPLLARAAGRDPKAVPFAGETLDLVGPYPRLSYRDALREYAGVDLDKHPTRDAIFRKAKELGVAVADEDGHGTIIDAVYKKFVRPSIIQPTFLVDHPVAISPLAKRKADAPDYAERCQLVLGRGIELTNAFSELNDPVDQEARLRAQQAELEAGDEEAQRYDEDFVVALRHGMPPTAGYGLGVDRLVALLTDARSVKETILFPTLRPAAEGPA